jgi:phospholipase C
LACALAGIAAAAALAAAAAGGTTPGHLRTQSPASGDALPAATKIQHVVIIMQENRSFDSYFGTFPGADGIPGRAGNTGVLPCLPDPQRHKCWHPFHDRRDLNVGGPHAARAVAPDVNGGKMNGFVKEAETKPRDVTFLPPEVLGYHDGKEIPNYWAYARGYALEDHMFEPVGSWSLPAHMYMVSLWSAHCTKPRDPQSCRNDAAVHPQPPDAKSAPHYAWTDLTYLLHKHDVSWRYYIFKGIEPDCETDSTQSCAPVTQGPTTNPTWNPLRYFDTVREDHQLGNITSLNAFFAAASKGKLPAVSWVVPNREVSEHPNTSLISHGQTYVTGLVNTIMESPDWDSTAIFVAWDDWGGLYDNVPPPHVDRNGYGLRVPAFMISPYAKQGYIDHQTLSFDAYDKFIEDDFLGGQRVDPQTDGRPDPRPDVRENAPQLGDLMNEFDFTQQPLPPMILPVHPKTDLTGPR